jgi:hypothetical protein
MEPSNDSVFGVLAALLLVILLVLGAELYWRGYRNGECKAECREATAGQGDGELDDHDTCLCTINGKIVAAY